MKAAFTPITKEEIEKLRNSAYEYFPFIQDDEKKFPAEKTCTPNECPMTYYCIPNGQSVNCSKCGRECSAPNVSL